MSLKSWMIHTQKKISEVWNPKKRSHVGFRKKKDINDLNKKKFIKGILGFCYSHVGIIQNVMKI